MQRVWLSEWEWACCGTSFAVGDVVALQVGSRMPWIDALLGDELARTVDLVESHHDEPGPDRLVGRVAAMHAVVQEVRHRRVRRDPAHPAPMRSTLRLSAADGEGSTVWAGFGPPSPFSVIGESVPGTAALVPLDRVPRAHSSAPDADARLAEALRGEGPGRWTSRHLAGYLVDIRPADAD